MAPITFIPSVFVWETPDSSLVYFILLLVGISATSEISVGPNLLV